MKPGWQRVPSIKGAASTHQDRQGPAAPGPEHSKGPEAGGQGRPPWGKPSGQHGSSQTQGLSWEVAGGPGVQCRVERGACSGALISPEPRVSDDPQGLGLKKQMGTELPW